MDHLLIDRANSLFYKPHSAVYTHPTHNPNVQLECVYYEPKKVWVMRAVKRTPGKRTRILDFRECATPSEITEAYIVMNGTTLERKYHAR